MSGTMRGMLWLLLALLAIATKMLHEVLAPLPPVEEAV